ncbi:copper fist DNA binding domain-containing protein [Talaromyces proteolyticus]|uniref:Copper fist DNA binding domain-containing protein n=1 Tax=Talaromyces proteolyticus TaxID=1131652 RepID=A0AAD4PU54_9EURO|nr:copper fist DNA binding domain-containing protein [Talaromyces proteolyticus]KAH8694208.1 copper fist DNA binding domain-containing protein [Talaromyces proteolyticus]
MLIDGEKWACEACVRGHRVSSCRHHDRPLIRINKKGRPFSVCCICRGPCTDREEHSKLNRDKKSDGETILATPASVHRQLPLPVALDGHAAAANHQLRNVDYAHGRDRCARGVRSAGLPVRDVADHGGTAPPARPSFPVAVSG